MFRKDKREAAALWDQGSRYVQEGDIQTGIELLAQAADLYEEVGALQEAVESADALAILLTNVGAPEEALHFYRRSLALEQWRGNRPGAATSWANMGTLHLIMGNTSEALTCQQEALSLFRSLGDQGGEAHVLFNLGNIYVESDAHVALTHYEQAATLTESLGLDAILFGTLAALGTIYSRIGRPEQAVVTLERALTCLDRFSEQARVELVMAAEDPDDPELTILEQLTTICTERRDFSRAMEYCHRGLAKQRAAGDQQGVAKFKGLLGSIHLEVGETDQALEYTDDALRFLRQNPDDPEALARNLGQLARVYQQRGELRHALTKYEEALRAARTLPNQDLQRRLTGNLGLVYRDLGQFTLAIQCFEEALQLARRLGARSGEASQLGNLGLVFQQMKEPATAFEYLEAALQIQEAIGDEHGQAIQLGNIGLIALDLGNPRAAIRYFTRALELDVKLGVQLSEAIELGNLGRAYMSLGQYDEALSHLQRAIERVHPTGDRNREAIHLMHLGQVYDWLGRPSDALTTWNAAITLAEEVGDPFLVYSSRNARGALHQELGRIDDAYEDFKATVDNWEFLRQQIASEQQKFSFIDLNISTIYMRLIMLLSEDMQRNEEAYEYVRRAKSQVFADQVSRLNIKPPPEVPYHLRETEQQLLRKLRTIEQDLAEVRLASERNAAWVELGRTQGTLDQIFREIAAFAPEYAEWRQAGTLSLNHIHMALNGQGKCITLVEFYVAIDKMLMFVLRTGDPDVHKLVVPVEMARLEYSLRASQREIAEFPSLPLKETWNDPLKGLLDPLRPYLDGCDLLCFVPHMHLHLLPLHALMIDGTRLIERTPIVYLPTSRLLEYWRQPPRRGANGCLALGYTPHTREKAIFEEEAIRVAELLDGTAYVAQQGTRAVVQNQAKRYGYVHLSCHGYFDEHNVWDSGLGLADGRLTVKDIARLDLNANLVVLSSCETGRNMHTAGDNLVGLARSFIFAGADSLLVSLWKVHGEFTLRLMEAFYGYLKDGHSKAAALQRAGLDLMAQPQFAHPYYWASFVLIGDWR